MEYYTYLVNDEEYKIVLNYYSDKVKANQPYISYIVYKDDYNIKFYTTNKILFSGKNFYDEISYLDKMLNRLIKSSIGSDEVGFGDLFGPLVVVSCFLNEKDIEKVRRLGVKDSKNITDENIIKIAERLINELKLSFSLMVLENEKYNEINKKLNMNEIKARLHNQAILKTIEKINLTPDIILDQFCSPDTYYRYLEKEKTVVRNIIFETKAESKYLSVACASIIARYAFINKFEEMKEKYMINFPKGCSNEVKKLYLEIKEKKPEILDKISKLNFKIEEEN